MEDKKYLNEENYQKGKEKVKTIGNGIIIVGLALLVVGIILLVLGFINFGGAVNADLDPAPAKIFGGFGLVGAGFWLTVDGFVVTLVGLVVRFLIYHKREITAFTTQQVMPVAKEGIEEISPSIGKAAKEISKGIKEGINEANSNKKDN